MNGSLFPKHPLITMVIFAVVPLLGLIPVLIMMSYVLAFASSLVVSHTGGPICSNRHIVNRNAPGKWQELVN